MTRRFLLIWDDEEKTWYYPTEDDITAIKQKLGICNLEAKLNLAEEMIEEVREMYLDDIIVPRMKKTIIHILKENPNMPTRKLNEWRDLQYGRLMKEAFIIAKDLLLGEGKITYEGHGRGKDRTWSVLME